MNSYCGKSTFNNKIYWSYNQHKTLKKLVKIDTRVECEVMLKLSVKQDSISVLWHLTWILTLNFDICEKIVLCFLNFVLSFPLFLHSILVRLKLSVINNLSVKYFQNSRIKQNPSCTKSELISLKKRPDYPDEKYVPIFSPQGKRKSDYYERNRPGLHYRVVDGV